MRIFKRPKSADDVNEQASSESSPVHRAASHIMACAPAPEDMTTVWKSIDAPRSTLRVDNSNFFLPAGPTVGDKFWMVLNGGDIGLVTKNGFRNEDNGVQSSVKRKDRRKGFTVHCGTLAIDFLPSSPLRRCFVGHGTAAEKRVVARLRTDCQYAADKVADCMASMLWHRVQSCGGSATRPTETEVADDLNKAGRALGELVEFAAQFVEAMRRQYQGGGREDKIPAAYGKALRLLGLAEWYRLHRALNAAQCMEKASRQSGGRTARLATQERCENFIQSNLLGMLGWRLAPRSMDSQRNVLRDALTALDVLGATDWDCFEEENVRARIDRSSTTVRIVKEAGFAIWTQQKLMMFLRNQPLGAVDLEEVRSAGQELRSHEMIHPAHLRVLRALPWVKTFEVAGHMPILRLVALDSEC